MPRSRIPLTLLAFLVATAFLCIESTARAYSPVEVAELARPATVGVYSAVDGNKFYGTGVIIRSDGTILTSTSVVPQNAQSIQVYFADHTSLDADILEYSADSQSVLLRVITPLPRVFPFLSLQRELPRLADPVFTLGNASNMIKLGDGVSFSAGVVSGMYPLRLSGGNQNETTVIETDAAVNDGQDGGGLINSKGEIIGIISRDFSKLRWQGTAIPAGKIISSMSYFNSETGSLSSERTPDLPANPFRIPAEEIAPYLVEITVERTYPPERLTFPEWTDYQAEIPGWNQLPQNEQRRIIVDFFSAESLIAANQMLRRPADPVTGLLISPDGYILTSSFNVESTDTVFINKSTDRLQHTEYNGSIESLLKESRTDTEKTNNRITGIHIRLSNGEEAMAAVVGFSTPLGLALLKADIPAGTPYYPLRDNTGAPVLGEEIAIIGSINNSYTINTGIVSAQSRDNGSYFQTDALINYGNSGGPIINREGRLLGLAARPLTPSPVSGRILPFSPIRDLPEPQLTLKDFTSTPNSGIAMGIMGNQILANLPRLMKGEGINESEYISLGLLASREDPYSSAIVVGQILENSPAARAGFKKGDIIREIDGIGVRSWDEVNSYITQKQAGQVVVISIIRPLEKPYLLLNGNKISSPQDLYDFIKNNKDGTRVSGHVSSPGISQKLYVSLTK